LPATPTEAATPAAASSEAADNAWAGQLPATPERPETPNVTAADDVWSGRLPAQSPDTPAPQDAWKAGLPAAQAAPAKPPEGWNRELPAASDAAPEGPVAAAPSAGAKPHPPASATDAWATGLPASAPGETGSPAGQPGAQAQGTLDQHLGGKPAAIVELFAKLDDYALGLDAERRVREQHVEYRRAGKPCFTMEAQRERVLLRLSLDAASVRAWWWSPEEHRYTIDIRPSGPDEMEYSVGETGHVETARRLIALAYHRFA
jgi:hypothetical protein